MVKAHKKRAKIETTSTRNDGDGERKKIRENKMKSIKILQHFRSFFFPIVINYVS